MFVKKLIAVCITALLMTGATLFTFERFGAAAYNVALRAGDIEMKKVEVEQMKIARDVIKTLPPEALVPPKPKPSPSTDGLLQLSAPIHTTPSPTPALDYTDSKVILNEGDGKQVLNDYDGKQVLPFNDKVVLDETPPVAIDLPRLPPNTFVPHIPETSP